MECFTAFFFFFFFLTNIFRKRKILFRKNRNHSNSCPDYYLIVFIIGIGSRSSSMESLECEIESSSYSRVDHVEPIMIIDPIIHYKPDIQSTSEPVYSNKHPRYAKYLAKICIANTSLKQ